MQVSSTNVSIATHVAVIAELPRHSHERTPGLSRPADFVNLAGNDNFWQASLSRRKFRNVKTRIERRSNSILTRHFRSVAAENLDSILKDKLNLQLVPDPYPVPFIIGTGSQVADPFGAF